MTNGHKNCIGFAYQDWCRWNGFEYTPVKFKRENKLPYIPSEVDLDQLIAGNGNKIGCFLQFLKESACRPIEAWRLTPEDFDLNQQVCYINKPAKGSNPRVFKMSDKLTAMVTRFIRNSTRGERIWRGRARARIENTLVYTHLIDFDEVDSFSVKVASSIEEFTEMLESGFEYVSDYEGGLKILRKRK